MSDTNLDLPFAVTERLLAIETSLDACCVNIVTMRNGLLGVFAEPDLARDDRDAVYRATMGCAHMEGNLLGLKQMLELLFERAHAGQALGATEHGLSTEGREELPCPPT